MTQSDRIRNNLGRELQELMESNIPGMRLGLVTATPFRGDGQSILPPAELAKFQPFVYHFHEYLRDYLTSITGFQYPFVAYRPGELEFTFRMLLRKIGKRPTIVFCGAINHHTRRGQDALTVERMKEIIAEEWGVKTQALDLVTQDASREHLKHRFLNKRAKKPINPDIALNVNMLGEGSDWTKAEVVIDMNPTKSTNRMVQRFGRLTRPKDRKTDICYYTMMPLVSTADPEKREELCDQVFTILIAAQMHYNMAMPPGYGMPRKKGDKGQQPGCGTDWLEVVLPDQDAIGKVQAEAAKRLADAVLQAKAAGTEVSNERMEEILRETLEDHGVTDHLDEATECLKRHYRRMEFRYNCQQRGIHPSVKEFKEAGFRPGYKFMDGGAGFALFAAGLCGYETYEKWNEARMAVDDRMWKEKFEETKKNGCVSKNDPLGRWQQQQRQLKRNNTLVVHRAELLDSIAFPWSLKKQFRPFIEARAYIHTLNFRSSTEYWKWSASGRRPKDIPSKPDESYPEFIGWYDWLGNPAPIEKIDDPEVARELLLPLHINSQKHFRSLYVSGKIPPGIPPHPHETYKQHPKWKGSGWLFGYPPYRFQAPNGKVVETWNVKSLVKKHRLVLHGVYNIMTKANIGCQHRGWIFIDGPNTPSNITTTPLPSFVFSTTLAEINATIERLNRPAA